MGMRWQEEESLADGDPMAGGRNPATDVCCNFDGELVLQPKRASLLHGRIREVAATTQRRWHYGGEVAPRHREVFMVRPFI